MSHARAAALLLALALACPPAQAGVVINEVLYHAPEHSDVQFIELHNPTDKPVPGKVNELDFKLLPSKKPPR